MAKDFSYLDLLNSENSFVHDEPISQSPFSDYPDTQEDTTTEVLIPSQADFLDETTRKRTRKSKFTSQEDLMLVSAWLNVSLDPIIGTDQKSETYWERIHAYYEEHRQFSSTRSPNSLMHRWSAIKVAVNKFQGYISKIDSRNQSGITEQDKICQAMEMYKSIQNHPFPFIHCWKELRFTVKFGYATSRKKNKDSQSKSSFASPKLISSEDNDVESGFPERPIGRKAAKEMSKKRKGKNDIIEDDTRNLLAEIIESQKQQRIDRRAATAEFLKIEKEREEHERKKAEREQMLYEERIIGTNTR